MKSDLINYAFIDCQNLYLSVRKQGWDLDFHRFRNYLTDKFKVDKAYLFIGYIAKNKGLYNKLRDFGYIIIFKPVLFFNNVIKGNCDTEFVMQAMIDFDYYRKAILVSGDGDFFSLAKYLKQNNKLKSLIIPDKNRYSALLKKISTQDENFLVFLNDCRSKLEDKNKKGPVRTKP